MNTNYEDQLNNWMGEWKNKLEEMREQFSSGKMDATESFEKQKDVLRTQLTQWKSKADETVATSEHEAKKMKAAMELLMLHLNLGKADARDKFDDQRKKIEHALQEVYTTARTAYDSNFNHMLQVYDNSSKAFSTNLEIVKLQFALGKMNASDDVEQLKKQLSDKMNELHQQYTEHYKQSIDTWSELLKGNYEKMQKWMEGFMPKQK